MGVSREELHRLIDALPTTELATERRLLEYVRDAGAPLLRSLANAPLDDEPETPEEAQAVREAIDNVDTGRVVLTKKRVGFYWAIHERAESTVDR